MNSESTYTKKVQVLFGGDIVREGNKLLEMGWKLLHIGQEYETNLEGAAQGTAAYYGWGHEATPLELHDYEGYLQALKNPNGIKIVSPFDPPD